MLREPLVQKALKLLEDEDYVTSQYHGCFDIAAKKELLLLIKILQNVDAFQESQSKNLKIISNNLDARPLLIGGQTNMGKLKKGIVYERFELPTVSFETFQAMISQEIFPKIYRNRGGLYVEIDQEILKSRRKQKGLTQRELAEMVGINKKVIYEHEKRQMKMLLDIAERIENILERKIVREVNPLKRFSEHGKPEDRLEGIVAKDLRKLGFQTDFVKQAPFDVFAKEKILLISDVEENRRRLLRRAVDLKNFISIAKKPALLITEKTKEEDLFGIPVLQRKELEEFESGKDLIKVAKKSKL
jgi:putative transcriptional regulator